MFNRTLAYEEAVAACRRAHEVLIHTGLDSYSHFYVKETIEKLEEVIRLADERKVS